MSKRLDESFAGLAQNLLEAIQAMKTLAGELHDNAAALGHLEQRAISVEADVSKLYTIMFEGDGKPSVAAQVVLLSNKMVDLDGKLSRLEAIEEAMRQERYRSWMAILVALIAAGGVIAGAILR